MLTAVLTHLPARVVEAQLAYMRAVAPDSRFVVCHGGKRSDFDGLSDAGALFIEDPSLRGPHFDKSLNETMIALFEAHVRDDPSVDLVYLIEYDHLLLSPDFEPRLRALAEATGAGLLAKWASERNDSNWPHHLLTRDDATLNGFIDAISVREDKTARFGCLGNGLLLTRDAFAAYCTVDGLPERYVELMIPTVVHHLGFDVVDADAVSDLYLDVRWLPEFDIEAALAAKRAGRLFVHPFKDLGSLDALRA
jgi:hypothetical protein